MTTTKILDCKYPGAAAWGNHYPGNGKHCQTATNGSQPGYVAKPAK